MNNITIKRCDVSFGSQLMSIISGIAYVEVKNLTYLHTHIFTKWKENYNEIKNTWDML